MITNVAIVEADRALRNNLEWLINGTAGFRCIYSCGAVETAMRRLPGLKGQIVLIDPGCDSMGWREGIWRLKELLPRLRVIVLMDDLDNDHFIEALKAEAIGYVLKQSGPENILAAIRNARDGGVLMSCRVTGSFHHSNGRSPARLTTRESEILTVLAQGYSNKAIADRMSLTVPTVRTHLMHIYEKLHVRTRSEAIIRCLR